MCFYSTGAPRVSSQFHQEFPSLLAAGEGEKEDGPEEEPYGPGPSLRPQSMAHALKQHSRSTYRCLFPFFFRNRKNSVN